jgi:hypothetical protein
MAEGNGRVWSPEITEIGDRLVGLTVAKAVELGDYMEDVHKIKPAARRISPRKTRKSSRNSWKTAAPRYPSSKP